MYVHTYMYVCTFLHAMCAFVHFSSIQCTHFPSTSASRASFPARLPGYFWKFDSSCLFGLFHENAALGANGAGGLCMYVSTYLQVQHNNQPVYLGSNFVLANQPPLKACTKYIHNVYVQTRSLQYVHTYIFNS